MQPELQVVQLESQVEEPELQLDQLDKTNQKTRDHGEPSEPSSESRKKDPILEKYVRRHHAPEKIYRGEIDGIVIRKKLKGTCFLSEFKPRYVKDALENEGWIEALNEEIEKIKKNKTWSLVPRPKDNNVIGPKWIFRNKLNEKGEVTRNKARLACKSYAQEEGFDYGETFSLVARLEGVRILLAYATQKGFKIYQMDVKSTFLNGVLEEEVYIDHPKGFVDPSQRDMVCKLHKSLYGSKHL